MEAIRRYPLGFAHRPVTVRVRSPPCGASGDDPATQALLLTSPDRADEWDGIRRLRVGWDLAKDSGKLGLWLIGATGNVATTVAVGLAALRRGLHAPHGMMTERPPLSGLPLRNLADFVIGGHEIAGRTALQAAESLMRDSRIFDRELLDNVAPDLRAYQKNIKTGCTLGCGPAITRLASRDHANARTTARAFVDRSRKDLRDFRRRHKLDRVVVINVASTEPRFAAKKSHANWSALEKALLNKTSPLPASSLYAIAAIEEGMPYVNFTPSLGGNVTAIRQLAELRGVPIMGADGKTGETLLKSVLAPMFRDRNLPIDSWVGHNVLGNGDGLVLDSAANKSSKLDTKNGVIGSITGYRPQVRTTIEYVESLGDWKTAWDHVHFRGFLDTRMTLQFVWQGCDSILAAPLVLDLARLADYHASMNRGGVMTHLACYFKSPMGVKEHAFGAQVQLLVDYASHDLDTTAKPNATPMQKNKSRSRTPRKP
ncbi:MAG: inositol-3-phosphate synthase [Phycisphaerales bacterium]|nr:inositol-3-phosphate synthase [Phycisphaerales bacterium]MCB9854811.1 inositol-3-phosphate synthase [Phycisphaerales bacterium]MCB9863717.1 inositol-3-phosphate synthase [Phycisphaerales bacterium]